MMENTADLYEKYIIKTYSPELTLVKGEGCFVWDDAGKKYLDFTSGISVCNLGHSHPHVTEVIQKQCTELVHVSNLFYNVNQAKLAERIARLSFGGRLFFTNSGAEANEAMIKFARRWGDPKGKSEIIYLSNSFHGRTLATLSVTDKPKIREGFGPLLDGCVRLPFDDIGIIEKTITAKTAAVMLEPIQGEGGICPIGRDILHGLRKTCDRNEVLLLFDEIQCGMGRTGKYFAYQHYDVQPDAMTIAKALGNGIPIGALEVQDKWSSILSPGSHASTFGGGPLATAAALAVFDVFEKEDILANCQKMGERLKSRLLQLAGRFHLVKEIRGIGLMLGVELDRPVKPIIDMAKERGLLILSAGENILRILPPLIATQEHIDTASDIIENIIGENSK